MNTCKEVEQGKRFYHYYGSGKQERGSARRGGGGEERDSEKVKQLQEETKKLLRTVFKQVHPDIFANYPRQQRANVKSFQALQSFLRDIDSVTGQSSGSGGRQPLVSHRVYDLHFYVFQERKAKGEDKLMSRSSHRRRNEEEKEKSLLDADADDEGSSTCKKEGEGVDEVSENEERLNDSKQEYEGGGVDNNDDDAHVAPSFREIHIRMEFGYPSNNNFSVRRGMKSELRSTKEAAYSSLKKLFHAFEVNEEVLEKWAESNRLSGYSGLGKRGRAGGVGAGEEEEEEEEVFHQSMKRHDLTLQQFLSLNEERARKITEEVWRPYIYRER